MAAKQPVNIGGIEFDALINSTEKYEAEVPQYTTEKGYDVSDNISIKPVDLSMTLMVSNRPVTWRNRFGQTGNRVSEVVEFLKNLYFKRQPVSVSTTDASYENMAIESISFPKTEDMMEAMIIEIEMVEIEITELKTATIPDSYLKSGQSNASAGTASTSSGSTRSSSSSSSSSGSSTKAVSSGRSTTSSKSSGSILYNAGKAVGLWGK